MPLNQREITKELLIRIDRMRDITYGTDNELDRLLQDAEWQIIQWRHTADGYARTCARLARENRQLRERIDAALAAVKQWEDKAFIANAH